MKCTIFKNCRNILLIFKKLHLRKTKTAMTYLTGWDWAIILFYFAIIAGISVWAVKKKDKTSADD